MSDLDVLVVAGEASGDQHAADLVAALKRTHPELRFFGMGGPRLAAQGVELLYGAHEISVMGIVEVLPKIPRIWKVLRGLSAEAARRKPKVAILVDVPDFNFRLARRLKPLGVRIAWYVSPTVWAWRPGRAHTLAQLVDRLMCILPFEEAFLRDRGVNATYVGNPVVDQVPHVEPASHFRPGLGLTSDHPVLAVLPGSRKSEIKRLLPTLVDVAAKLVSTHPGLQLVVPIAPGLDPDHISAAFASKGLAPVLVDGHAPEAVGASDVALVASGTATLEAGLMRRPLVAVYRVNALTYFIGRLLVKVPFFCLVNLLVGRRLVPELLQGDMTVERIIAELEPLWAGPGREQCLQGLDELRTTLGPGGASERAAQVVAELL